MREKRTQRPAAQQPAQRTSAAPAERSAEGTRSKKKSKKKGHWFGRFLLGLIKFCFAMACLGIMAVSVVAVGISSYLAKTTVNDEAELDLDNIKLSYTSAIYVKDTATGEYYEYHKLVGNENREWVELKDIPEQVQNAFIAAEDENFWTHNGFSFKRNVFAVLNELSYKFTGNYLGSGIKQGASTIDQQLIKNITFDDANEGSEGYMRKVREIFRAYMLEKRFSKEMILEAYLNVIRLTGINAGVQAGAQTYFGKDVDELTLAETASLACITNNPTKYNPWNNPEDHMDRRNYVLDCMWNAGYIDSEAQYKAARNMHVDEYLYNGDGTEVLDETTEEGETTGNKIIQVTDPETGELVNKVVPYTSNNSWFVDQVLDDVTADLMEQKGWDRTTASQYIFNSGLKIYCTMVPEVQEAMEEVMADAEMFPMPEAQAIDAAGNKLTDENGEPIMITPQSGMACVNYAGELVGIVGGLGTKTEDRAFNRASDAARPVGSTMKPIGAYALGIENDYITYSTMLPDVPIQVPASKLDPKAEDPNAPVDWPRNYAGTPSGNNYTIVDALGRSLNTIAIHVGQMVTPQNSYEFLTSALQVSSLYYPNDVDLSPMVLGGLTEGISPYELAGAYMIFGNGGKYTTLHSYTSVEDRAGEVVLEPVVTTVQAISEETAMIMNKMLQGVLRNEGGTGRGLYVRGDMESAGKTGTTSDDKDHWFVGITPYYSTATWWGYDDQIQLQWKQYGKHPPTLAWRAVMEAAQAELEYKAFPASENVEEIAYCADTGCRAGSACPTQMKGYYKVEGRQPEEICTWHGA